VVGEAVESDAAVAWAWDVVQELQLVLGEIVIVGPMERAPQPTVQPIELFRFWTIHVLCCSVAGVTSPPLAPADALLDTWAIHNRIHLYLLDALSDDALRGQLTSGGRDVAHQFAHVHNVRLMWLTAAAPELLLGLESFDKDSAPSGEQLAAALTASSQAISALLQRGLESGRVKSFKPHPIAFFGYLIAHESSHRGEIGVALTQAGHRLPNKIAYGLWEWGSR
jgi:uncharacterized damage-inducible protein DinB